jgi:hypothetical protein
LLIRGERLEEVGFEEFFYSWRLVPKEKERDKVFGVFILFFILFFMRECI